MFRLPLAFILILVFIAGCHKDEGRSGYDKAMKDYGPILIEGLNEKNVEGAMIFGMALKSTIKIYPHENWAQEAKGTLEKRQKVALKRQSILEADLDAISKSIANGIFEFEMTIRPLGVKAKKFEKNFFRSIKLDTNSCLFSDISSETEQDEAKLEIYSIDRVKKVGKDEVILEEILKGSMLDLLSDIQSPIDALKRENPTRTSLKASESSRFQIDCKSASKIVDQYRSILKSAVPSESLRLQLTHIKTN